MSFFYFYFPVFL